MAQATLPFFAPSLRCRPRLWLQSTAAGRQLRWLRNPTGGAWFPADVPDTRQESPPQTWLRKKMSAQCDLPAPGWSYPAWSVERSRQSELAIQSVTSSRTVALAIRLNLLFSYSHPVGPLQHPSCMEGVAAADSPLLPSGAKFDGKGRTLETLLLTADKCFHIRSQCVWPLCPSASHFERGLQAGIVQGGYMVRSTEKVELTLRNGEAGEALAQWTDEQVEYTQYVRWCQMPWNKNIGEWGSQREWSGHGDLGTLFWEGWVGVFVQMEGLGQLAGHWGSHLPSTCNSHCRKGWGLADGELEIEGAMA